MWPIITRIIPIPFAMSRASIRFVCSGIVFYNEFSYFSWFFIKSIFI